MGARHVRLILAFAVEDIFLAHPARLSRRPGNELAVRHVCTERDAIFKSFLLSNVIRVPKPSI